MHFSQTGNTEERVNSRACAMVFHFWRRLFPRRPSLWGALAVVAILATSPARAGLGLNEDLVNDKPSPRGAFPLVSSVAAAPLVYDASDFAGVRIAVNNLQQDVERVTGRKPEVTTASPASRHVVMIGTLGKSRFIDSLAASGKLDVKDLKGRWECFVIATVERPVSGVDQALVIAGSDKRGTIYGIYELSEQLGVSPWYWWADVPPRRRPQAHVRPGRYCSGEPAVRYRGIFLNDEEPALGKWTRKNFGGFNSKMYARVFELLLRLRGNYLWPAMWGKAFNEDDPANPQLADEYGIVMGTSHHEPMMRAQQEWTKRKTRIGNGQWNYETNGEGLRNFWEEGIARNKDFENIVTIGMRGDGDKAMSGKGSMDEKVALLERIVAAQRTLIAKHVDPDPARVPQIWALYKEVLDYYNHGMRVPDDVTLLWCDDNWGDIRRLPTADERLRPGGAGIYYHLEYVGAPRSYKWINTDPLPKIWEQMHLAYQYEARRIWIANVGDLKPLEIPTEFFLRMAWDPDGITKEKIGDYTRRWAERDFGPEHAAEIADIVAQYGKYAGWRKPELIDAETFSLIHYREAERVSQAWQALAARAEALSRKLPQSQRDAYEQLVLYPVRAMATVVDLHIATGRNRLYAAQGRASANAEAARVRELFRLDQELADHYNLQMAGGKWDHMMDQTHIGFSSWRDPEKNILPDLTEVVPSATADWGVAIDGSAEAWPGASQQAVLPPFDSLDRRSSYFEVFQRGQKTCPFSITAAQPWIVVKEDKALQQPDKRFLVEIDWNAVPAGKTTGEIVIAGAAHPVSIQVVACKATKAQDREAKGCFAALAGPIAIAAEDATHRNAVNGVSWEVIPDYGRGASGMSIFPVTADSILPPSPAPSLEYPVFVAQAGPIDVDVVIGPTLDFVPGRGLRLAVSFDDAPPQVLDVFAESNINPTMAWRASVQDNIRTLRSTHQLATPGRHTLKLSMVDPGVVVQKVMLHDGPLPESYFGPDEK